MRDSRRASVVVTFSPQPSVAEFLRRIVEDAGFVSRATSTFDELRDAAAFDPPDAIVYEIGFPFVENWRQFTRLRSDPTLRDIPVVITTADARELHRRTGVHALEVFRKPDDLSQIRETVRRMIDRDLEAQAVAARDLRHDASAAAAVMRAV